MPIHYVLRLNNLTDDPNEYRALVHSSDTIDLEALVEQIVQRGSTVGRADILGVVEDTISTIEVLLLAGFNVTTPLANFSISVQGRFDGPKDSFDPARHRVVVQISPGRRLRRTIRNKARLSKRLVGDPAPNLLTYLDVNTGMQNRVLTPGGLGQLVGARLKFDPADPRQGIFIIAADRSETRVKVVGENRSKRLAFLVPSLPAGGYRMQVRATIRGGVQVRTGELGATLTVGGETSPA